MSKREREQQFFMRRFGLRPKRQRGKASVAVAKAKNKMAW